MHSRRLFLLLFQNPIQKVNLILILSTRNSTWQDEEEQS
jgi:hypothetical protein